MRTVYFSSINEPELTRMTIFSIGPVPSGSERGHPSTDTKWQWSKRWWASEFSSPASAPRGSTAWHLYVGLRLDLLWQTARLRHPSKFERLVAKRHARKAGIFTTSLPILHTAPSYLPLRCWSTITYRRNGRNYDELISKEPLSVINTCKRAPAAAAAISRGYNARSAT